MKRITAMLMAIMTFAAVSLTGCSDNSALSKDVSGLSSEKETFGTTSVTTTAPAETSAEEDNSIITADTREELTKGLLEAILADDKDTVLRYNFSKKAYTKTMEALVEAKEKAGLNDSDVLTIDDFEIYITGPSHSEVGSATANTYVEIISKKLSSLLLGPYMIIYDYDSEQYMIDYLKGDGRVAYSADSDSEYAQNGYDSYYDYVVERFWKVQPVA